MPQRGGQQCRVVVEYQVLVVVVAGQDELRRRRAGVVYSKMTRKQVKIQVSCLVLAMVETEMSNLNTTPMHCLILLPAIRKS